MRAICRTALYLIALIAAAAPAYAGGAADATGHWEGTIEIPGRPLDLAVDIARGDGGGWIGSLTIARTTTVDVPLIAVGVDGTTIRFTALIPGETSFQGALSADANSVAGTVSNADGSVPFRLMRHGEAHVNVPPPSSPLQEAFAGTWDGTIEAQGKQLAVELELSAAKDGTAVATLRSVEEGQRLPFTTVVMAGRELRLESRAISATYRGSLEPDGRIVGEWSQGGSRLPLTFARPAHPAK